MKLILIDRFSQARNKIFQGKRPNFFLEKNKLEIYKTNGGKKYWNTSYVK